MSTKHTPGPWEVKRSGTISDADGDLVATCGYRVAVGSDEDDANARLIAAAPDLLEALRALADSAGLTHTHEHDDYGTLLICHHCNTGAKTAAKISHKGFCIVGKARAAIAKAEGRS